MAERQTVVIAWEGWPGPLAPLWIATALSAAAKAMASGALLTRWPGSRPVPTCESAAGQTVPVRVAMRDEGERSEVAGPLVVRRDPFRPGLPFGEARGTEHEVISHLILGELDHEPDFVASPWAYRRFPDEVGEPGVCEPTAPGPIYYSFETELAGSHSFEHATCFFVPTWIGGRALRVGDGDYVLVARSEAYVFETGSGVFGLRHNPPAESASRLVVARGPEPMWRFVTLRAPADVVPALRRDGDDVVLCTEEGSQRVSLRTFSAGPYRRWPRRRDPLPFLSALLALAALLACAVVGIRRLRAARPLLSALDASQGLPTHLGASVTAILRPGRSLSCPRSRGRGVAPAL